MILPPLLRLSLAFALISSSAVFAQSRPQSIEATPSAMQIIRRLLGVSQRVAAAGSRSDEGLGVCLITPSLNFKQNDKENIVLFSRPAFVSKEPLNEIQIALGDQQWQALASSKRDVERIVNWPFLPLKGGETIVIKLRPKGAAGADYSELRLTAASGETLKQNSTLIMGLGSNEKSWINSIKRKSINDPKFAIALLFSPSAPDSAQIKQMRSLLIESSCN
ncbi:hypothetical protein PMIT1312_00559 [Prochlorococcus marinus str. MIT 1312]|nr:hypothetical protein PMIT1312_00559 [Prochlorococcus marinus str. MIT 1312]